MRPDHACVHSEQACKPLERARKPHNGCVTRCSRANVLWRVRTIVARFTAIVACDGGSDPDHVLHEPERLAHDVERLAHDAKRLAHLAERPAHDAERDAHDA
jgi:hypothetical protein